MTPLEILVAARERISAPERWTQHANARSASKCSVEPLSQVAVCWCSLGALIAVIEPNDHFEPLDRAMASLASAVVKHDPFIERSIQRSVMIARFNDNHTYAEVLSAFDSAIESQRAAHA